MEDFQNRNSGIPRLSRLPLPRTTASTPGQPASALPRPNSLRPSPSREALTARSVTTATTTIKSGAADSAGSASASAAAAAGDVRSSRLRHTVSRDRLRSSIGPGDDTAPRLRASVSRDQLRSSTTRAPFTKPKSQPPVAFARASSIGPTSQRRSNSTVRMPEPEPFQHVQSPSPDSDSFIIPPRRVTLTRRPSESLPMSPNFDRTSPSSYEASSDGRPASSSTEESSAFETIKLRASISRPSLSERTMETLAQIPSSPAVRRKSSAFFDQSRPKSRENSTNSRPGSSYNSDGSARNPSRPASRPGSSAGPHDPSFTSFRASTTFKAPHSFDETPRRLPSIQTGRTTNTHTTPVRSSMPPPSRVVPLEHPVTENAPSPSPRNKAVYGGYHSRAGSQTIAGRPVKRTTEQGLYKKPSLQTINQSTPSTDDSRETSSRSSHSLNGSWDGSIPSLSSTVTSATADSSEPAPTTSLKSSAALREQIAKAKAAKRAIVKQVAATQPDKPKQETPIVPSDDGFDFGVNHHDPFNLRKTQSPSKTVLSQRVSAARTSGKLNIAALSLKEIPLEVLKMYDLESIGTYDGSWAESVDLTRFVAADNEFETLDDFMFPDSSPESMREDDEARGSIFAGLETLDLHGNLLISIPIGFRRLPQLTSLNLSSNRLSNNALDTIGQMTSLRDLKLANNLLYGPLSWSISNLTSLEILDLHGNNVSALPRNIDNMSRLRILNLNENSFESLPFDGLAKLPLTELLVRKNKLKGTLIEDEIDSLPHLQTLDVSSNQLTRLVPLGSAIDLPVLHALSLSMNRLQGLPDMTSWGGLLTLTVDENSLSSIPNSFTSLMKLRHADFASNDIRVIPPEIARMDNLSLIRLSGNPLRDKKLVSMTTDELKEILANRLEPPPSYEQHREQASITDITGAFSKMNSAAAVGQMAKLSQEDEDGMSDLDDDDFATPPTSLPQSPRARSRSQTLSSLRSRSQTLSNETWPVKAGGLLDRSRTDSSSLHPVVCSRLASEHKVKQVHLQHNLFTTMPSSLNFFAETLTALSMAGNQMVGESYILEMVELPALTELNLSSNYITSMAPLTKFLHAPKLEKIDLSLNRMNALPKDLKEAFPSLKVLLVNNNHLIELDPEIIKGLKIVDASSNDITHLNPRIGLLGGKGGLERLDVMGNRFRVPRYNVLERGTDATLRWLRGRVPIAEMASWRKDNSDDNATDDAE